jgi:hypothetical protein
VFGFLRKKLPPSRPVLFPPILLPQSAVDSNDDHAILQAIDHFANFMTTKAGYRAEDLDPAVNTARSFDTFIGTLVEKGHGCYGAMLRKGEIDPANIAACLTAIGASQLLGAHAAVVDWLRKNPAGTGEAPYQIQSPDLEALDKLITAKLEKEAYQLFKTWFLGLPIVRVQPDNIWREELQRIIDKDPRRGEIRVSELEKQLSDPLTVGLHLALGTHASKTAKDLTCVTGMLGSSRGYHPSDPNGSVYLVNTNIGHFLGYRDQLGVHLALGDAKENQKPDTPATEALRPARTLWTATPAEIQAAIDHSKRSDAAFAAVCLLDCLRLGKDIAHMSYTTLIETGDLAGKDVAIYRVTAASDKSKWFVLLSPAAAFISAPNLDNIEAIHVLRAADLQKLKRNARIVTH